MKRKTNLYLRTAAALSAAAVMFFGTALFTGCSDEDDPTPAVIPELAVSPETVPAVAAEGGTAVLTVTSNVDWTVTKTGDFITVSPASGTGNGTVNVTVAENTGTEARSGKVTVTAGDLVKEVTVPQDGTVAPAPVLTVSPEAINLTSAAEATQAVTVTSNVDWTVSKTGDFISVSATGGTGDGTFNVVIGANPTTNARSGDVKVTAGDITRTIAVSQPAAEPAPGDPFIVVNGLRWLKYNVVNAGEMPTVVTLGGLFAVADAPNACPTGWRLPKFDEWKGITDGGGDWNFHAGASVRQDVNGVNGFFMAKGVGDVLVANTTPTIESHVFVPFLNASAETPVADRVPTGYAASDNASYPGFRITPWDNGNDPWKFWVGADNEGVGATYGYRVRCVQEAPAPGVVEIAHGGKIWADRNLKAIGEWADNPGDVGGLFGEAIRPGNNPDFDAFCPAGWHLPSRAEYEAAVAGQTMFIFDGVETSVQQDVVNASTSTLRDAGGHELVLPLCTNATCGDTGGLYIGRSSGVAFDQGANADNSWLGWGYFTWWPWENHMSGNDNQNQGWKTLARCVKD